MKTNAIKQILSITLTATLLVATACGQQEPVEEFIPQTNDEHNQMLDGLGFDTELGERTDNQGEPLPEAWHPLRTRFAAFFPKQEIYTAGPILDGSPEVLREDALADYAPLAIDSNPDESWTTALYKDTVAADVDGDGYDELVTIYFATGSSALKYLIVDPNDNTPPLMGVLDQAADATGLNARAQPSLAAGDLDRDGFDEVAVGFGKLYLIRDLAGDMTVTGKGYLDKNDVMVAIGNTDLDPADELVVTHTETVGTIKGFYEIIDDGDLEAPTQSGDLVVTDSTNKDWGHAETRVAIGDVDGDRINDILFHGRRTSPAATTSPWNVFILRHDPYYGDYYFRTFLHQTHASNDVPWTLLPVDADGDGIDEIYAWDEVFEVEEDGTAKHYANLPAFARAAAGNVDSDWREEIVLANRNGYRVYGLDGLDEFVLKHEQVAEVGAQYDTPSLALVNVDSDSPMVRYDGEHELLFTAPNILTVMSAPPFHKGIGQDVDNTATTYGIVESSQVVTERSMGVSVGFSVGYEWENDLVGVGASAKASFEAAFDFYASESKTRENYYSHTSAPGEDKVVFSTVPFDVYYYTIVSSPNPDEVGRVVTVNMPRNQQVIGSSIEFYNNNNGGALDIDEKVLDHRAGDVWSYPSPEDKETILNAAELETPGYLRLWNGPLQVDESGYNTLGLSESEGSARGASMDFSATFEAEVKAGGATVGASVGFHYGYSVETSTEEGSFYEGSVGSIPGNKYSDYVYCYGLMVYPKQAGDQRFVMVDYWTQQRCGGM